MNELELLLGAGVPWLIAAAYAWWVRSEIAQDKKQRSNRDWSVGG